MADGNFNPCECVFTHDSAMKRLISLLRSSQGYCTSDECFQDLPGPANVQSTGEENGYFQFMMIWVALAMVFFLIRPPSLFRRGDRKPSNNQGPQPPPPDSSVQ